MNLNLMASLGFGVLSAGILGWAGTSFILIKFKFSKPQGIPKAVSVALKPTQKILLAGLILCLLVTFLGDFFLGLLLTVFFLFGWMFYQKGPAWKLEHEIKK